MTKKNRPTLIVIIGPTGVGKTDFSIKLATKLKSEIISADSRQFYKQIPIGTAAPTKSEMKGIKHHLVGNLSVTDYYNVSMFEQDVLKILKEGFKSNKIMIMAGGSGMYINGVCKGIDQLPDADKKLRAEIIGFFRKEGIEGLRRKLQVLDPVYYKEVDLKNPKRLMRAIEVCVQSGKPYSQQRKGKAADRNFNIIKVGLELPRKQLNERIERRLSMMIAQGWLEEAKAVVKFKVENALNTVGYKELFQHLEGELRLDIALEKINVNTRKYAKRQMTWFKRDQDINWFSPFDEKNIFDFVENSLKAS